MLRYLRRVRDRRVQAALLREPSFHEVRVAAPVGSRAESIVASHWIVYVPRLLEALGGVIFFIVFLNASPQSAWLPLLISIGLVLHAGWKSLEHFLDVMVITDIRVFRITGLPVRKRASMPLTRILDITVERPMLGAVFDYGHFIFESAAQTQGMKDVRYVPHPFHYEKLILRHVHASSSGRGFYSGPQAGSKPK
jgi:hypothetical protein